MVIGKEDGTLSQFTHTPLIEKKKITACPTLTEKAKISDVQWLSTYIFAVNYESLDGCCAPNVYTVHLAEKGQTRDPIWRSFEDPTYAGDIIRKGQMYFPYIVQWNVLAVLSSNSGDGAVLGKIGSGEHRIWNMADHLRFELPLDDAGADANPCVIGASWNFNSKRKIKNGEVVVSNGSPTLFVLSSLGDLVKYELFNTMSGFPDMYQVTDRMSYEGIRASLPPPADDDKPKPRISLTKPLERTTSLIPTSKPNISTTGSSFFSTPAIKAPIAQSTPAPGVVASVDQSSDSIIFPDKNQTVINHTRQVSHEIIERKTQPADNTFVKQPNQIPAVIKTKSSKQPTNKLSGLTKQDLVDLVADFEKDFEDYKLQNSKISFAGLDEESKSKQKKSVAELISFESEACQVCSNNKIVL